MRARPAGLFKSLEEQAWASSPTRSQRISFGKVLFLLTLCSFLLLLQLFVWLYADPGSIETMSRHTRSWLYAQLGVLARRPAEQQVGKLGSLTVTCCVLSSHPEASPHATTIRAPIPHATPKTSQPACSPPPHLPSD